MGGRSSDRHPFCFMKKIFLLLPLMLIGCDGVPPQQPVVEAPQIPPKYQVVYSQTIELDGSSRWLGEIQNTETKEEYLVIQGSEAYPYTMVKK
jgi:hypothetical protein